MLIGAIEGKIRPAAGHRRTGDRPNSARGCSPAARWIADAGPNLYGLRRRRSYLLFADEVLTPLLTNWSRAGARSTRTVATWMRCGGGGGRVP